ncbi:putative DinG family ATP-dependent helicase YoaA [Vibrio nigripulchritudo SFn27]|uniref:ATP-dependent DNA helicase YoaA n=1 Tax=Vibrio nigripulchritudo TaxID=28173 RepID=U4K017_9VIBR|nr:ATP-dependent DNA helicase [Vibrio nigripulchritudo]CCN85020.1 putative DinG family ATP-dependent helicase YoaA [Vibrio nigripulchritudo BLFn1]CCN90232.1 putative DinG family ATP-dependent helicase YoaA [Vibrio nigripulchritudo SFn27]CCN94156.1 putative DinG family ATP-dependent helicase YoaA [Vibrio nigripulchritudo ENn2]CCO42510.1 putative DinG family ATP-dependent helicase YoaA [Vibrio nigripulchritudo SFn135]CCO51387.1 putative DinG family ATP-dependent helicase YoaA [Vibrio nigripulchr
MIDKTFSSDGALGKAIKGFQPRQAQLDMARAVEKSIKEQSQLVVEAGTGTGKTFAYLVPALLSGKKTIISTGSKNLQEQLFHRDLPLMTDALGFYGSVALLKGRSNYLCLDRLSRQMVESHTVEADSTLLSQLVKVRSWASETKSGDLGECSDIAEDSPVIPDITSTNDNCLGKECPSYQDCFVVKARQKAMDSDVVVVNHHLFLADLAIKETGFGELIPEADVFVFDEAHQIPDIASQYFGSSISSRQIQELSKDIEIGYRTEAKDMRQLQKVADRLVQSAMDMRLVLGEPGFRGNWREAMKSPSIERETTRLIDVLDLAIDVLKVALGRSELLDAAFERANAIKARIERVCEVSITGYSYWFECSPRHFSLHITPLSVAEKFREQVEMKQGAWIFTSATLAVQDDFSHFTQRLGLAPSQQFSLPSPFDYEQQARLCVPRYLPEPNSPGMADRLAIMLGPVIEKNGGRCFFLCTSHSMMRELAERFREQLSIPVLMQGETTKQKLLAEYLELGNALLVATGAFWEGIDVRGDALSCVIIDKLPFTAPDDPLLKARIEDCRLSGGEPFNQVQIPDAVITLKQGVGRLIRDKKDQGALIICDNRLVTRDYGAVFLRSLPPIPRTRDLGIISEFLEDIDSSQQETNEKLEA